MKEFRDRSAANGSIGSGSQARVNPTEADGGGQQASVDPPATDGGEVITAQEPESRRDPEADANPAEQTGQMVEDGAPQRTLSSQSSQVSSQSVRMRM